MILHTSKDILHLRLPSSLEHSWTRRFSFSRQQSDISSDQATTKETERLLPWLKRTSPKATFEPKHLQILIENLEWVEATPDSFLIVVMPPRHGKSTTATEKFPVWFLKRNPRRRVICGSYNQTLANRFSRKSRRIATTELNLAMRERVAAMEWETIEEGGYRAVGVGAGVTGHGGDLIIIDDPVKNREEAESEIYREKVWTWWTDDLSTRREPGARTVVIATRWHADDLIGRLLKLRPRNLRVVHFPAIATGNDWRKPGEALWPERYNEKSLALIREGLTENSWASLYQGEPVPAGGLIFKTENWRFWYPSGIKVPDPYKTRLKDGSYHSHVQIELPSNFDAELDSWDMAFKDKKDSSWVVGQAWARLGSMKFLLSQDREKRSFSDSVRAVVRMRRDRPGATVLIEDKANGPAIIETIKSKLDRVIAVEPDGSKEARAHAVTDTIEAGDVYLPHPDIFPWVRGYLLELSQFNKGTFDDQVDATTQALRRFQRHRGIGPADAMTSAGTVRPRPDPFSATSIMGSEETEDDYDEDSAGSVMVL